MNRILKRVSVAWLPVALVLLVVSYWVGRRSLRPDRAETPAATTAGEDPSAEATDGLAGGSLGEGRPRPSTGSGRGPEQTVEGPRDTSTPSSRPGYQADDGIVDPTEEPPAGEGSLSEYGTDPGRTSDFGKLSRAASSVEPVYGAVQSPTQDETDPGWDDDTDAARTREYTTDYDSTTTRAARTVWSSGRPDGAARELAYTFHLFDGFERGSSWAVESAADHAELSLSGEKVSEGQRSLKARFKAFGRGNFELRREVDLDLTEATTLRVDVYNEAGVLDLVLGCRAGYDAALFATPPKAIQPGWNEDVSFSLDGLSSKGPSGTTSSSTWNWSRDQVSRVSLIFRERGQKEGTVHVDNIRFDRRTAELGHKTRPDLRKIVATGSAIERFESIELTPEFEADYQDFFDRAEVDVLASFFSPSGKRLDVHGFVHSIDAETARPVWKVRFTPGEVGVWRYDVTVTSAGGEDPSGTYTFTCHRRADRRGFIRRSKWDGRYFEFDDGSFYYPFGQNVCWASNYDYFLKKIQDYGGNYVRVWLCPWNLQLEDPREPGKYDLRAAGALDALVELCERRGIYMQLVLRYHGMHQGDWQGSPYNADNGGPCTSPGEVFTDAAARDQHKRFLDYVVARWGHSTAIFAWELWNEADLARADRDSDLVAWHREMSDYLRKIDVHRHLVTTSVAGPTRAPGLFELPNIDFVPVHFYSRDVFRQIYDNYVRYRELRKPVFIGEFSGGHKPADDLSDTKGVRIRAGLWLAFVTPMAGSAMPWWWDTYIDKNDLYGHWAALAKFAVGTDRRGKHYEVLRSKIRLSEDAWASMQGLVSPSEAFLWIYDEARILRPEHGERPLLITERPVRLRGMLGGTFRVEIWDTQAGEVLSRTTADTSDGELSFTLPKTSRDIAVKIVREGEAMPRLEW